MRHPDAEMPLEQVRLPRLSLSDNLLGAVGKRTDIQRRSVKLGRWLVLQLFSFPQDSLDAGVLIVGFGRRRVCGHNGTVLHYTASEWRSTQKQKQPGRRLLKTRRALQTAYVIRSELISGRSPQVRNSELPDATALL